MARLPKEVMGEKDKKFYLHLHLSQWISDLGSPANYNTQWFESNHKIIVKNVADNVQKHGFGKFLSQIAVRGFERQLLSVAMEKLNIEPILLHINDHKQANISEKNDNLNHSWYTT